MQSVTVKAYAKINLALKVLGKRDDGYHKIETLLHNIDLADTLTFKESTDLTLQTNVDIDESDNLVVKAAKLLRKHSKTNTGASITLEKNIPIEAGLGGGSADAAITLLVLNQLWDAGLEREDLYELGAELGSDVSFFLKGGFALAKGRGEKIISIEPIQNLDLVIAKPDFGISAKEAYEEIDKNQTITTAVNLDDADIAPGQMFNDLEPVVLARYKELQKFFDVGYKSGASKVMLSGSGSAFFAIVENEAQNKVYDAWQKEGLLVYKSKTIDRSIEKIES